jgi:hypothetical protein
MEGDASLVNDVDNLSQTQQLAAASYHLCHYLTDAVFILCYKSDLYTNWKEKLIKKINNSSKTRTFINSSDIYSSCVQLDHPYFTYSLPPKTATY